MEKTGSVDNPQLASASFSHYADRPWSNLSSPSASIVLALNKIIYDETQQTKTYSIV